MRLEHSDLVLNQTNPPAFSQKDAVHTATSIVLSKTARATAAALVASIFAMCLVGNSASISGFADWAMGPLVKVDTSSLSWWQNTKLGFDPGQIALSKDESLAASAAQVKAPAVSLPLSAKASHQVAKPALKKIAAHVSKLGSHIAAKLARRKASAILTPSVAATVQPTSQIDTIAVTQAQKQLILPVLSGEQERTEMRRVRSVLRQRVRLAFLDVRTVPTAALVALPVVDVTAPGSSVEAETTRTSIVKPSRSTRRFVSQAKKTAQAEPARRRRYPYSVRGLRAMTPSESTLVASSYAGASSHDRVLSTQSARTVSGEEAETTGYSQTQVTAPVGTAETQNHQDQSPLGSGQILVRGGGQTRVIDTGATTQSRDVATQGVSFGVTSQTTLAMNTQPSGSAQRQNRVITGQAFAQNPGVTTQASPNDKTEGDQSEKSVITHKSAARTHAAAASYNKPRPTIGRPAYVEAFQWLDPVFGVDGEVVSHEGTAIGTQKRWVQVNAGDHWPTLSLSQNSSLGDSVPLISDNNLRLLESTSGIKVTQDGGIVFGRLPRDVNLAFSGRAENRSVFTDKEADEYQDFILLNVEPGAHLLHLSRGLDKGAIAVPVRSGVATYVDLTDVSVRSLEGSVISADDSSGRGLSGIRVSIVGQVADPVRTDSAGAFSLPGVLVAEGHPVYLETDASDGHTHRYAVGAEAWTTQATLFRFSSRRIEFLTQQLEGGVSPDSGLVMGAFPRLVAQADGETLYPSVRSIDSGASLSPETYTLDTDDRMLVNAPLTAESPRFAAAQVPAGANLLHVEDKAQGLHWSQLIMASPGVVNVVTP